MKKPLLLSLFAMGVVAANAQITITVADIAAPPAVIYQANDTIPTISVGSAGAGMTWNFTGLSNDGVDTINFHNFATAPNPAYAGSNLVFQDGWQPSYGYLVNNASMLSSKGFAGMADFGNGPTPINQKITPYETIITYPATMGTNFTSDYRTNYTVYFGIDPGAGFVIDSLRSHGSAHKVGTVDAWGSLTTPLGTYNVIRMKETKVSHDTTDAFITLLGGWQNGIDTNADSSASYTWWANGVGFPLVEARMDSLALNNVTWLLAPPASTVGISEATAMIPVNVYPNPAQTEINLMMPSANVKAVKIYDITGRLTGTFAITADVTTINTAELANGSYTYTVIGNDNEVMNRGKFTVAK